jgi:hypothetical protein
MEVIVAYDDLTSEVARVIERFAWVKLVDIGTCAAASPRDASAALERIDRRRSAGLGTARGRLVGMLVDRGWPRPDWARRMVDLQDREPCAAIGGAILNGAEGALRRAVFLCDFGRFQPPLADTDPEYVSDVNVCYNRSALESTRTIWEPRFKEAAVHWEMRERGEKLLLSDEPVIVHQRGPIRLAALIRERIDWGRNFGRVRGAESTSLKCLLWATLAPLLPFILLMRQFQSQLRNGRADRGFYGAIPALIVLLTFWSLGEFLGYLEMSVSRGKTDAPPRAKS